MIDGKKITREYLFIFSYLNWYFLVNESMQRHLHTLAYHKMNDVRLNQFHNLEVQSKDCGCYRINFFSNPIHQV